MAITRCPIGGSQSSCRLDPAARRTPYHRSNKASSPCSASSKTRYSVLSNLLCSLGLREIHIKPYQYVLVVNHLINSPLLLLTSTKQLKAGDQSGKSHFNTYTTWARREGRDCWVPATLARDSPSLAHPGPRAGTQILQIYELLYGFTDLYVHYVPLPTLSSLVSPDSSPVCPLCQTTYVTALRAGQNTKH